MSEVSSVRTVGGVENETGFLLGLAMGTLWGAMIGALVATWPTDRPDRFYRSLFSSEGFDFRLPAFHEIDYAATLDPIDLEEIDTYIAMQARCSKETRGGGYLYWAGHGSTMRCWTTEVDRSGWVGEGDP